MFSFNSNFELYISILKSFGLIIYLIISGKLIANFFFENKHSSKIIFQNFIYGYVFNAIVVNFLIFFKFNFNHNFTILLYFLTFLSCIFFFKFINLSKIFSKVFFKNSFSFLFFFVLLLYFFLSLAPITSADSLDYHMGVPLHILKYGKNFDPLWFNAGLAGISDYFLIISIQTNAEQFGTLIQFISLLSIIELFYFQNLNHSIEIKFLFISIVITIPVLLFLTSSPKPQLSSIAISVLIFHLILNTKKINKKIFILISILIIFLSITKLNFLLTSVFLFILLLSNNRSSIQLISIFIFLIISFILYIPLIVYKINIPGSNIFDILLPVPHNYPGYKNFLSYLRFYTESSFYFPFSIIFPDSLGNITTVLGINIFILLFLFFKLKIKINKYLIIILIYFVFSFLIGQRSSRFFLEIYLFFLFYCFYYGNFTNSNLDFLFTIQKIQLFLFLIILLYSFFKLVIGSFNLNYRELVLENNADGYNLSKWVNKKLPDTSYVLLDHRSVSLFKQHIISADWSHYISVNEAPFYDSIIRKSKIDYVIILSDTPQNSNLYKYCNKLILGPHQFTSLNRNPFRKKIKFKAWIYEASK